MKNNIEYYQHFTNSDQHPKFKMLRVKYGWAGEGKFWALNNRIGLADDCVLDLSKKYNIASIAYDLDFTLEEFNDFIQYLNDDCNLITLKDNKITTQITKENLDKVMNKRVRNQKDYVNKISETLSDSQNAETEIKTSENIQSKVKESKVNKSNNGNLFDLFWLNYPKKVGKGAALKAWNRVIGKNEVLEQIKIILPEQISSVQWNKDNGQYIPNPATYINQRRWEDEI